MDLIGKTVQWELSGRGRGTIEQGEVVLYVPSGTTNAEAVELLRAKMPGLRIRPKYCRFNPKTHRSNRVFVLVEKESKRVQQLIWIYAPNALEVQPV